ncbi:MAG: hypothetical protein M3436_00860 [Pseudomonadota bacterium]|nr:hypothetical protein [Pseudomonadota bacterium]
MHYEQTGEIGRIGRTAKVDGDAEDDTPLVTTPELRAMVIREFKKIEKIEEEIAERRLDIKVGVKRMVGKGLNRRAVNMALARRKLLVKGGLDRVDESLAMICGIGSLGIQGELFQEAEEGGDAA